MQNDQLAKIDWKVVQNQLQNNAWQDFSRKSYAWKDFIFEYKAKSGLNLEIFHPMLDRVKVGHKFHESSLWEKLTYQILYL